MYYVIVIVKGILYYFEGVRLKNLEVE